MNKMINEVNQNKNHKPLGLTLNSNYYPTNKTKSDYEWESFKYLVYSNIEARLKNIILRMYKWKLPDTMNERMIEQSFLYRGWVTIFKHKLGIYSLGCIPNNMYNIYGEPTQVQAIGYNGWNEIVNIKYFTEYPEVSGMDILRNDSENYGVVARDNYDNKKYIDYVEEYARILTDNRLAIMIATDTLKQPRIVVANKMAIKKQLDKIIKGIQDNKRQIITVEEKLKDNSKSMSEYIADIDLSGNVEAPKKLVEIYNANFNLFLETIGINTNPSPDKSEVVLNAELSSNNSLIDLEQDVRFFNRKKLCEDANKMFGLQLSVEKNIEETSKLINDMKMKGTEDESIIEDKTNSK